MQVIARFAPEQHIYSIDESFLSMEHSYPAIRSLKEHGMKLRQAVWRECRLPVCVGFGATLTLAKVANHAAKKIQDYNGVCVLNNERERKAILEQLHVAEVWGIGPKLSRRLEMMGVNTALKLANYPPALIRKEFNVEVERTVRELNGQQCKSWDSAKADKKQIFSTRSTGTRITDLESLQQAMCKHANIASFKARKQKSLCQVMLCFANSSPFDAIPVARRAVYRFAYPTSDVTQITQIASRLAEQLFQEDVRFYKIGVGLIDLVDGKHEQPDLFNLTPNNPKLMNVYDTLNNKYGSDALFLAAQGISQKWVMRRKMLSPQYTTRWQDLPKIKC